MVSGLVTSPCDQLRIFSGEARLIRMASKSAIGLAMSKGLERYKVVLRFPAVVRRRTRLPKTSFESPGYRVARLPVTSLACGMESNLPQAHFSKNGYAISTQL